jgi:hypothetical protein
MVNAKICHLTTIRQQTIKNMFSYISGRIAWNILIDCIDERRARKGRDKRKSAQIERLWIGNVKI